MWRGALHTTHLIVCVMFLQSFPVKGNVSIVSGVEKELASKTRPLLLLRERLTRTLNVTASYLIEKIKQV